MIGSSGTSSHSKTAPSVKPRKTANTMTPKPKPLVAAADGTLRNQPRLRHLVAYRRLHRLVGRRAGCPASTGPRPRPGGRPPNSSVSSTISCGAVARLGSTRVTWKSFLPSLCTVSAPRDGQVDDGRRGLPGVHLPVDQQPRLGHRDPRWRERDRDRQIGIARHHGRLLPGQRHGAGSQPGVPLVAAVLAPPEHADDAASRSATTARHAGQRDQPGLLARATACSRPAPGAGRCRRSDRLDLDADGETLAGGQAGLGELAHPVA